MKQSHSVLFLAIALLFLAMTATAELIEPAALVANTEDSAMSSVLDACESKSDPSLQIAMATNLGWLRFADSRAPRGHCGDCSQTQCQGQAVDAICGFDGETWYRCLNVLGERCGPSGQTCSCVPAGTDIP